MSRILEAFLTQITFAGNPVLIKLWVPEKGKLTHKDIVSTIQEDSNFLKKEKKYIIDEKNYEILLNYVCKKHGWLWEVVQPEISIVL